jgi:DNA-binding transcriptional ArsR family regulator
MTNASIASAVAERLVRGPNSAAELIQALNVSQTTVSRALRELERQQQVLRMGSTRGARYALRRRIASIGTNWPVYRIDEQGTPRELGVLWAIERNAYYVTAGPERIHGLFGNLPYYLQDAKPAGFLGRAVPAAYPELALPPRVADWTDEHFLLYLTQRGADGSGDLVVGIEALNRFLAASSSPTVVSAQNRMTQYPAFAAAAMAGAPPGSSLQGEHPKFTACVADGDRRTHVIVKFSPPRSTPTGQRWVDLLTAEHSAHRVLEEAGIAACHSRLFDCDDRVFLECDRFDRIGADGRRGVVSLFAVDTQRYGRLDNWTASADRLADDSLLSAHDAERIRLLDAFGALTANTDRHFGNLTLFDRYEGLFDLAPIYDMLPMLFAPRDGQIVARQFEPMPARAGWLSVWSRARELAEVYWDRLAQDPHISRDFRQISAAALNALRAMPRRGAAVSSA